MTSTPDADVAAASPPVPVHRRAYIDWARGVAVLIMIGAHILDAWTRPSDRPTSAYGLLNLVAGYAAPLFLWLAGLSMVLAGDRGLSRGTSRHAAAMSLLRRGALVFALAFLFRLQAFVLSPGNPLVSLLRVDILNVMGPALMAAALVWGAARGQRTGALLNGAVAVGLAMATPVVRSAQWVGQLPPVAQWYLTPAGNHSTFTLFPWAGFVFAGASFGSLLSLASRQREGQAILRLTIAGLLIGAAAWFLATRPSIYPASSFWTSSPTYFAIRVAVVMMVVAALYAVQPVAALMPAAFRVLERFGRHSLFIYWIHVELVYGYATLPLHRRLPLWGTAMGFVLFTFAMYGAIALRGTVVNAWRIRRAAGPPGRSLAVSHPASAR